MRAILAVLALAIALTGGAGPAPAAAAEPDNKGPACTDIKGIGSSFYEVRPVGGPTGTATFLFEFYLAAAPCANATYYLYITDGRGASVATATYPGAITSCGSDPVNGYKLCYTDTLGTTPGAPTPIYVTGASMIGNHTADTTPPKEFVLCDANSSDSTYPNCSGGDNSWDQ